MKSNVIKCTGIGFFKGLFSLFGNKVEPVIEPDPAKVITKELNSLWEMAKEKINGLYSEAECREKIIGSFKDITARFTNEQLVSAYVWPRYVKVAVNCVEEPIAELINYVDESNYISLTKRLSDLSHAINREEDAKVKINMEKFSKAVYLHILEDVNPGDIPSCLALGRMYQNNGEYEVARNWFEKITETDDPFNGITALIACYDEEAKVVLSKRSNNKDLDPRSKKRVRMLNELQCAEYEKWIGIMEERINGSDEVPERFKRDYVRLMTRYARFERNRCDCDKAVELLDRIPKTYPDIYRVYTEKAMLCQFKSYKNCHYSLEKAVDWFKKAEDTFNEKEENEGHDVKSKKCILMPLANTYFQLGRYDEAKSVCDRILKLDNKEYRAINLRARIVRLAV